MKTRNYTEWIVTMVVLLALPSTLFGGVNHDLTMIWVFAGDDTSICYNSDVDLSALQATISGDVDDGTWFTQGDGFFQSTGTGQATFSTATTYHPGSGDVANGFFELILVSDDPDGNGPMVEVTDAVTITFQTAPALVCNSNLSVSLDGQCQQELTVPMLVASPEGSLDQYTIEAFDESGDLIPNHTVVREHIGQVVSFKVRHACNPGNSCGGSLTVSDYIAPVLICSDTIIDCDRPADALSIGLPVPADVQIDTVSIDSFQVAGWDACTDVWLTYRDTYEEFACTEAFLGVTHRFWTATDQAGNQSSCNQSVFRRRIVLDSVTIPPNYNDIEQPALSCHADFPRLSDGHPDPRFTGSPSLPGCTNIEAIMTDTRYDNCGGSFSIWRNWTVIDWCTATDFDFNQIIKVADTTAPQVVCPDSLQVGTDGYNCWSRPFDVLSVDSVEDCSDWTVEIELHPDALGGQVIDGNGLSFDEVPAGTYDIVYHIADACGNDTTCQSRLRVIDTNAPFAICDGFTKVALNTNGFGRLNAETLDDNSFDNCGIATMEVARMHSGCGSTAGDFSTYVDFCCADIGTTQSVAFRVTDFAGNVNTCMVEVTVEDKVAPTVICLPDITIGCDFLLDTAHLEVFGQIALQEEDRQDIMIDGAIVGRDGLATDNCAVSVSEDYTYQEDCGAGLLVRTFTIADNYGSSTTCTQRITIERLADITFEDINWPDNVQTTGCGFSDFDPSITGSPTFDHVPCSMPESTYEDEFFEVADSACVRIVRTWSVIDWCIYDPDTDYGRWSQVQVISVDNIVAPEVTTCLDTTVCTYAQDCGPAIYEVAIEASDDCTAQEELQFYWTIDSDQDGLPEYFGNTQTIIAELTIGVHIVSVEVEDACGNRDVCSYQVTVEDCKKPTPYCRSSISTVVMPTNGSVEIFARHFDLGGVDNCSDPVYVSFSPSKNDTVRVLTCDDLHGGTSDTIRQAVWFIDETGNADFCEVDILLQDNSNVCGNGPDLVEISGRITSENGQTVDSVQVSVESEDGSIYQQTWAINGDYSMSVPRGLSYIIRPRLDNVPAHVAVSTLDLVLTQRHIIASKPFDSPLEHIVADINGTQTIRGSDIVMMRELILRKINEIPVQPMTFVSTDFDFEAAQSPHAAAPHRLTGLLEGGLPHQNFTILKRGDVNGDYFSDSRIANPRSVEKVTVQYAYDRDGYMVATFYARQSGVWDGMQCDLLHQGAKVVDIHAQGLQLTEKDTHLQSGHSFIALALAEPIAVEKGEALFSLVLDQACSISVGEGLAPEVYSDGATYSMQLETTDTGLPTWRPVAASNPFVSAPRVIIQSEGRMEVSYVLVDVSGQTIKEETQTIDGTQELLLDQSLFSVSGMYFLRIADQTGKSEVLRLVKL